jgi:hypothetical protein
LRHLVCYLSAASAHRVGDEEPLQRIVDPVSVVRLRFPHGCGAAAGLISDGES